ncbi:MAG: phage tail assembly chaperone family protein, TAC [Pseudomonadota bacterium]
MADLSLDTLRSQGAFTGAPVRKEITYTGEDGEEYTATVHVRRLSYHAAVHDVHAAQGRVDGIAGRIAACICDAQGKPVFSPEDITGEADPERGSLNRSLTLALLAAIGEVNGAGKTQS